MVKLYHSNKQSPVFNKTKNVGILQIIFLLTWKVSKSCTWFRITKKVGTCWLHYAWPFFSPVHLFNLQFFFFICMLWFSSCLANNRPCSVFDTFFVIGFIALKEKFMSLKPSKNTMYPINPQRRSQEVINQIINHLRFYTTRTVVNHVWIFPQIQGRVVVFLKM